MGLLRQVAKQLLAASLPSRWMLTRAHRRHPGETARIGLTFDDGPHPLHTPVVLDRLREHGLTATFFVVGQAAEQNPELIRRIADEGHEIGNHTWSHSEPCRTSSWDFLAEVQRTDDLIEHLTGRRPPMMRPPKGELNWGKLNGLWRHKKTVALWNVDPRDYSFHNAPEVKTWCESFVPRDGDVILLHDNHPWAHEILLELATRGVFTDFRTVDLSTLSGISRSFIRSESASFSGSGV